ncbi:MAG TPA: hypothetical protein PKB10_13765, partial [Tepidisphaeraceae bacterium]|nr:hypothetical protein [Tepidisphaeraceae bacterium]
MSCSISEPCNKKLPLEAMVRQNVTKCDTISHMLQIWKSNGWELRRGLSLDVALDDAEGVVVVVFDDVQSAEHE